MKRRKRRFYLLKEILVGCFLILMLTVAVINIRCLTRLTSRVTELIEEAEMLASQENWSKAAEKAEEATRYWKNSDAYTHLVLRHSELESATDAIYDFLEQIYAREKGGAKGAAEAAKARMKSISSIEQIRLGSIF
jgi:TRAP-type C4-dicarboxylate transport system substrate-binding protein